MATLKIALIQFDIIPNHVAANQLLAEQLIEQAAALGAEAVVLPELWNTGYALEHLAENAENMREGSVRLLQRLAKKNRLFLFGGSIAEKKNNQYYNTQVVINAAGEIVHKYRKIHLFPLVLEEEKYLNAGDEWGLVETPWGLFGLVTCYDLRFPELIRNLVLRGAKAIVVPAQWPALRLDHWQILNQARAIENQVFVFAVNRTGKDKSGKYAGCSMVIDPWGKILAGGPEANKAGIMFSEVDFSEIERAAEKIPVFQNRRRILDEIDDSQV